ncbi:MAG: type II secretion system GspH family protein [Candidatus Margulisbacteria bacterium]|nr:type II secretion system GspH family protein [Candidatus Margulisiibacteriota bacterium]
MKRRGFTIIELLIVMAVIALLVGIAIPSFRAVQDQAKVARAQGDLRVMKLAMEDYYINNNSYPADDANQAQTILLGVSNPVLESNIYDPFGATTTTLYEYKISANGSYYVVYSIGSGGSGVVTINNTGEADTTAGSPIIVTNGQIQ